MKNLMTPLVTSERQSSIRKSKQWYWSCSIILSPLYLKIEQMPTGSSLYWILLRRWHASSCICLSTSSISFNFSSNSVMRSVLSSNLSCTASAFSLLQSFWPAMASSCWFPRLWDLKAWAILFSLILEDVRFFPILQLQALHFLHLCEHTYDVQSVMFGYYAVLRLLASCLGGESLARTNYNDSSRTRRNKYSKTTEQEVCPLQWCQRLYNHHSYSCVHYVSIANCLSIVVIISLEIELPKLRSSQMKQWHIIFMDGID